MYFGSNIFLFFIEKKQVKKIKLHSARKDTRDILGKEKGITGKDNSCYMDATLFCLFAFNDCLDEYLKEDSENVALLHLKDRIINPLRRFISLHLLIYLPTVCLIWTLVWTRVQSRIAECCCWPTNINAIIISCASVHTHLTMSLW